MSASRSPSCSPTSRARWTWPSSRTPSSGARSCSASSRSSPTAVRRFEGTVDKFTGDGIMAVFGAPVAHEDHARRACYAALRMLDDIAEYAAELRRKHGLNFSARIGINSGEVVAGAIGAGGDGELHGDRPHGRAGAADGGAGRARQGLPDRGHGRAGAAASSSSRTWASSRSRERAGRSASSSWPGSARPARGSTSRASAASPASSAATRRWRSWTQALERAKAGEGAASGSSPSRASARAASATSSPSAPATAGIEVFEARPRRTDARSPSCRCCRCCAPTSASPTATRSGSCARRSPAGRCCSTPTSPTTCPLLFDFLGVPDPDRPLPQLSAEARQRALRGVVCRLVRRAQPPRPDRHRDRGPALDRRGQRGACSATCSARSRAPRRWSIVNFRPEYTRGWSGPPNYREISLEPLGPERHPGAAARPGRRGPLARRARRADPRAHRGQPVLHRGDRPGAGRGRQPRGRARRLPAGAAGRGHRRAGQRADGAGGADRPARAPRPSGCCRRPRWPARRSARAPSARSPGLTERRRARGAAARADRRPASSTKPRSTPNGSSPSATR